MSDQPHPGPDIVIAGAARSGTSTLAAQLGGHPGIDPGKVKEPNYFSRGLDRGREWYDGLYEPRRDGLLRMDGSVSYTSSLYPDALARLRAEAPDVLVVYVVRDTTQRALSHFLFRRHYFQIEQADDFGAALRSGYYSGGSDYARWIGDLTANFSAERVLVVPFELVTSALSEVTSVVYAQAGLDPTLAVGERGMQHRNPVVEYRNDGLRRVAATLRHSPLYPRLRAAVGASRMRRLRGAVTRRASVPSTDEMLASCTPEQHAELAALRVSAAAAVTAHLVQQDRRLGLTWATRSFAAVAPPAPEFPA